MQRYRLIVVLLLGLLALNAQATSILADTDYHLENHPDGGAAEPYYGLRLDGLLTGDTGDIYTVDFEAAGSTMTLIWDAVAQTITIMGTAFGGQDAGASGYIAGTTALWNISFVYTDVYACFDAGLCSDNGSGMLSSIFGDFNMFAVGKAKYGYAFQFNYDHRGFTGLSGWGWVNHCPTPGGALAAGVVGASCATHLYSSDWLFTAHKVSEPGTLILMGMALLGMALTGRRRRRI